MKRKITKFMAMFLATLLLIGTMGMTVFAAGGTTGVSANAAYEGLLIMLGQPDKVASDLQSFESTGQLPKGINYQKISNLITKTYKVTNGGYALYNELYIAAGSTSSNTTTSIAKGVILNETLFNTLTAKGKKDFITDLLTVANAIAATNEQNVGASHWSSIQGATNPEAVDSETVNVLVENLQNVAGMGTIMLSSIMENTKPDFISANRIYQPFSGPVGTTLGLIAIIIMALLGITMALDIAYIVLPMFQMFIDGGGSEGGAGGPGGPGAGGANGGKAKIVSRAAINAVKACSNQGGAQGQQGQGNKMAIAIYLKYRWVELVVLGICLLYLVSGNIYSFVGQVLDLGSGFLGF